ncbi:MAG: DUF2442 domain-containing protein [Caldilineaceae bacterium]
MPHQLYRVTDFRIVADYRLWIKFNDGAERTINFEPVLYGEVFGPLRDLAIFQQIHLDPEARTLVWPTGADFDPETLHNWDATEMAALGETWARQAVLV